ncbi:ATP cone domain-containing protein, partial [uncultured Fenollaria sp.]
SCEKRPVSLSQIEGLADSVEEKLMSTMKKEVSSTEVGELIMQGLKEIDQVAYVRFASVYREFKDTQSFMKELQKIIDEQNN